MHVEEGQELRADRSEASSGSAFVAGSYAAASAPGIRHYTLAVNTGAVQSIWGVSGVPFPAYLAAAKGTSTLYAVSETTRLPAAPFGTEPAQTSREGSVWYLHSTAQGPAVVGSQPSGGELPTHLAMHPSGRWLVVSNYGLDPLAGSVAVFPIDGHGGLLEMRTRAEHTGSGPRADRQSCAHVHSTLFTASGDELIAADLGADALVSYAFDARTGALARRAEYRTQPGWGPRYLCWAADGRTLFVVGELACEVAAFAYDAATGTFELLGRVPTTDCPDRQSVFPSDLHLNADGQLLYVANRGGRNSLAVLSCADPAALRLVGEVPTQGRWPRDFALSPDGTLVVVANQKSDSIDVLRIGSDGVPREHLSSTPHPAPSYIGFV